MYGVLGVFQKNKRTRMPMKRHSVRSKAYEGRNCLHSRSSIIKKDLEHLCQQGCQAFDAGLEDIRRCDEADDECGVIASIAKE